MNNLEIQSVLPDNGSENFVENLRHLCDYGCGQEAHFQLKNRKWCCSKSWNSCPSMRKKNSNSILLYLKTHQIQHTSRGNYGHRGQKAWNKGLTKETDYRVKHCTEMLKLSYVTGKSKPSFVGKKHSEETKQKMRLSALQRTVPRVSKKRYKYQCIDGSIVNMDSSYEVLTAKILDDNNIKWIRPKPLSWFDDNKKEHHYFPDFYLIDYDLYLDPKNDWCIIDQKEKLDKLSIQYTNIKVLRFENINIEYIKELINGRVAESGLKQLPTK